MGLDVGWLRLWKLRYARSCISASLVWNLVSADNLHLCDQDSVASVRFLPQFGQSTRSLASLLLRNARGLIAGSYIGASIGYGMEVVLTRHPFNLMRQFTEHMVERDDATLLADWCRAYPTQYVSALKYIQKPGILGRRLCYTGNLLD